MTIKDHHLLCLGLLAKIGIQARKQTGLTVLELDDHRAIREAIQSAQNIGMPVMVERYDLLKAIHRTSAILDDGQ